MAFGGNKSKIIGPDVPIEALFDSCHGRSDLWSTHAPPLTLALAP
ncbi:MULTISPECIES: hypothetical protein [unclassified Mesorhizobium]|nr:MULTISPECIES: hypothetical protein [unclassified Mesorhizobium]ESX13192.1 hypothetical protein X768_06000 [Mesorhizobium sp. LSJC265A00]ESY08635.1 hypothetical protein X753_01510 [Mesorhizobium sp. LNJC399B00]